MNINIFNDNFITENQLIFKKYKPIKRIGHGNFGNIYSVIRIKDKHLFALKAEKLTSDSKMLESEAFFLFMLQGFGIPKFISYGHNKNYNILIEQLLDKSLYKIFIENSKITNIIDICLVGIQLLDRFEWIHSKNIIYRDIKPENFLIGIDDPNVIYAVDFGFCKKYRSSKTGKHILPKYTGKFNGTLRYASPNSIKGKEPSRRDDLISLGYMLIYLYKKNLPWDLYMPHFEYNMYIRILHLKENDGYGNLFYNLPAEFIEYIKYTKNLKFEESPNYSYMRSLFIKIIENMRLDYKILTFSWIHPKNKILFGIPRNNLTRNNTPHRRIYRNIMENDKNIIKRNVSKDNIRGYTGLVMPIHSNQISIITDISKNDKDNKVLKPNSKEKKNQKKEKVNNNIKIFKIRKILRNEKYNINPTSPNKSNLQNLNNSKFINNNNRIIYKKKTNNNLIQKRQINVNKNIKTRDYINSKFSKRLINEGIINQNTQNSRNRNYIPLFNTNINITQNNKFELKAENMRINERLKRINIKKDINYINPSHSDINDQIIIKNQKNIINFNNNIGNITFFKNNYRKCKSPSPIRRSPQERQIVRHNLNEYFIMNN